MRIHFVILIFLRGTFNPVWCWCCRHWSSTGSDLTLYSSWIFTKLSYFTRPLCSFSTLKPRALLTLPSLSRLTSFYQHPCFLTSSISFLCFIHFLILLSPFSAFLCFIYRLLYISSPSLISPFSRTHAVPCFSLSLLPSWASCLHCSWSLCVLSCPCRESLCSSLGPYRVTLQLTQMETKITQKHVTIMGGGVMSPP